jgi:hypothetical protein
MNSARLAWGLAVCLAVPLCAGCAADQNVVRGQAPPAVVTAPTNGVPAAGAQVAPGSVDSAACPQGACDGGACNDGYCHCSPRHYYTSCYDAPYCNNGLCNEGPLVYPPNPTPGAVVQYPYYICKGPDDFFHQ